MWGIESPVIVFLDDTLIGGAKEFIDWAGNNYMYSDYRPASLYINLAEEAFKTHLSSKKVVVYCIRLYIDLIK